MSSEVEICSNALTLLGADAITALTEDSPRARLCARHYPRVRDEVLRDHPWNCATFRTALAKLAAAPAFDYAAQYALPTDPYCLRVLATDVDEDKERWVVEGRLLLADVATIKIVYLGRVTDPGSFDPLLESALTARLAYTLAYPVTGKLAIAQDMAKLYDYALKRAKTVDGQEHSPTRFTTSFLTEVR